MTALEVLMNRRSIRRYTRSAVTADQRDRMVRAVLQAPSAADARPWHLVQIDERDVLDRLADAMPHCDMLREATWALLICGDPALEKIPGFWVQDCSAATQNALIAAAALGLGAVWIGLHPVEDRVRAVRSVLGVPDAVVPLSLTAVGHPAEDPGFEDRFDEGKLHTNRW